MCCATFITKYALFFFNLVFCIAGIALIGAGIAVLVGLRDVVELIPVNINALPISTIVIGSIIFFIAFSGCCGAVRESRCLLILYAVFMLILAAAKTYLAVVIIRNLDNLQATVERWITSAFNTHQADGLFRPMEISFRCCGISGADSYVSLGVSPPESCCANPVNQVCNVEDSYLGCSTRIEGYLSAFGNTIGYGIIVIVVIEVVAMIFALYLNHSITRERSRKAYY